MNRISIVTKPFISSLILIFCLASCGIFEIDVAKPDTAPNGVGTASSTGSMTISASPRASSSAVPAVTTASETPITSAPLATPIPPATPLASDPVPTPAAPIGTTSYYVIAPDDNGLSGPAVGCGDSAVQVSSDWPIYGFLPADIKSSLENLFAIKAETLGQSGLSHALHQANLYVEDVALTGNAIHIALQGDLPLQGTCMDARSHAQILHTVFQYDGFDRALITLNGQNLKQIFDNSGLVQPTDLYKRSDLLLPYVPPTNDSTSTDPTPSPTPDLTADQAHGHLVSLTVDPPQLADPSWRELGPGDTYTISWEATQGIHVSVCVARPIGSSCDTEPTPMQGSRTLTLWATDPVADHWVDIYVVAVGTIQSDEQMLRLYPRCHNQWFDESLSTWCPTTAVTEKELLAQPFENGWMVAHRGSEQVSVLYDPAMTMRIYNYLPGRSLDGVDLSVPSGYEALHEDFAAVWAGLYSGTEDVQTMLDWPTGEAFIFTYRMQCERRPQPSNYHCFELGPDDLVRVFEPFGAWPDPQNEGIAFAQSTYFFSE